MPDSFEVNTGVWQRCLLSPFVFLLVIDWIMKITTTGRNNGIQWTLWTQLDDLDFADDLAQMSQSQPDAGYDRSPGDHISRDRAQIVRKKTELMKLNTTANTPDIAGGTPIFRLPEKRG